jgi:hypothetical protein
MYRPKYIDGIWSIHYGGIVFMDNMKDRTKEKIIASVSLL